MPTRVCLLSPSDTRRRRRRNSSTFPTRASRNRLCRCPNYRLSPTGEHRASIRRDHMLNYTRMYTGEACMRRAAYCTLSSRARVLTQYYFSLFNHPRLTLSMPVTASQVTARLLTVFFVRECNNSNRSMLASLASRRHSQISPSGSSFRMHRARDAFDPTLTQAH